MDNAVNAINWFEISVSNMERAVAFYQQVFSLTLDQQEIAGRKLIRLKFKVSLISTFFELRIHEYMILDFRSGLPQRF
ncbi:MAG: hypothetical protein SFV55_19640 [Haliscomenobacter sp.]|uniref:hypothetical protein n=1 Tax=Haliscomenobacter sp. TaxID=2717303 RepID=UPI0029BF6615|nr:hypothetical protein [Haliscomenobacter sp.]MDX2070650.1 hypothetical protein [Haliscomenobacter sp.]